MYRWSLLRAAWLLPLTLAMASASSCSWSTQRATRRYAFDLGAALLEHPHGAQSEDGFYEVQVERGENANETSVLWFQLCGHMKFNSVPPSCQLCPQSCGGQQHCGEACSALQASTRMGYRKCTTVAGTGPANYSLIDEANPALGVAVTLGSGDPDGCPSGVLRALTVKVLCAANGVVEPPKNAKEEPQGSCQYVASMLHPSGCPVVTSTGGNGVGWVGLIFILFLCGAIVYFAVGLAYRTLVLGVSGYEAIPNLEFWQNVPGNFQSGASFIVEKVKGAYHSMRGSSSYARVS